MPQEKEGDNGGAHLPDGEGDPHTDRSEGAGQEKAQGDGDHKLSQQGDDQRVLPVSQCLESPGVDHPYGGDEEAQADDAQSCDARCHQFLVCGEHRKDGTGDQKGEQGSRQHEDGSAGEAVPDRGADAPEFSGTIVVPDDGAHTLDDPVSRHVDKSLQFIIYAKDSHADLGDRAEDTVQYADQDRRQKHHDAGGNPHAVDLPDDLFVKSQVSGVDADCIWSPQIDDNVEEKCADLSDDCGDGSSGNAEGGASEEPEDQDRVQYDVDNASCAQKVHGDFHLSDALKDLFESDLQQGTEGDAEHDICVAAGIAEYCRIVCKKGQERLCHKDAQQDEQDTVEYGQCDPDGGGAVSPFLVSFSKTDGNGGTDTHADAHAYRDDGILQGIGKGDSCKSVCPQTGHVDAVNDIIE